MPTPIPNIWQLQSRGDIDGLIEALRHTEPTVRKNAAAALRALGAWQAVPALEAALVVEHDWQAHAAITASLQYLDHDLHVETMIKNKDIRGLTKMLTSPRHEDIIMACEALATIGDRRGAESLVMVFRSPLIPNVVRLAAAEALLKLESAPAVVTLLGALRRDNWQVRRNAAAVLGQLQATWATQPLIETLNDPNQAVRRTAAAALRRFNTPEAVAAANKFEETQAKIVTQEVGDTDQHGEPIAPPLGEAKGSTAPLPAAPPVPQPAPQPSQPQGNVTKVLPAEPTPPPATPNTTEITITPPGQHQAPTSPVAPIITPPPPPSPEEKPAFADLAKSDTGVLRRLREKATGSLSSPKPPTSNLSDKPKRDTQPLPPLPTSFAPPAATPTTIPTDAVPLAPTPPITPPASTTPTKPPTDTAPLAPAPPPSVPEMPPEKPDKPE